MDDSMGMAIDKRRGADAMDRFLSPAPMPAQIVLTRLKETRNTIRYQEDVANPAERPVVGTIYLRKDIAISLGSPARIRVAIGVER